MNLAELNTIGRGELMRDCQGGDFGASEFNRTHNRISRAKVRAMLRENGSVFIWDCNPFEKTAVVWEYKRGMVYNFDGSFITPQYDIDLEWMMRDRLESPYTGATDDFTRINAIFDKADEMGMTHLTWS